eukprot:TRINITY_DN19002_c0_g1_i1.p1 TRINITY_DN19002_c0_g1~~TRINITY_DN19002_c0_g1_i1.p1  ORF type:complete len:461 (+),score=51.91 TRINITY_DN19002_c0_g1_i1:52-1434(+)
MGEPTSRDGPHADDSFARRRSFSEMLGFRHQCLRRCLLLTVCLIGIMQYGMVLTNGVTMDDFDAYYGLSDEQGQILYAFLNFGCCALSFFPGLLYDRLGPLPSTLFALIVFDAGVSLQLYWTPTTPGWNASFVELALCYMCFGFSSNFFNVIGAFAPLVAFKVSDVGKVSAIVQISLSLGMTVHSAAYSAIKNSDQSHVVYNFMLYSIIFTNVAGLFMCGMFWVCRHLFVTDAAPEEGSAAPRRTWRETASMPEFIFMNVLFFLVIGCSFSFLNCEGRIAKEVGIDPSSLATSFGLLNAAGRLLSIPLDYTRHHPYGGVFAYLAFSTLIFFLGMAVLASPLAGIRELYVAHVLISFGYGGVLGMVPPTLRLCFGTQDLGVIYGLLYFGVAISEPLWTLLFAKPAECSGISCYSAYTSGCSLGLGLSTALCLGMLRRAAKATQGTTWTYSAALLEHVHFIR